MAEDEVSEEKTAKYLEKLDRQAKRKERGSGQDEGRDGVSEVVVAGLMVDEEAAAETAEEEWWPEVDVDGSDDLDEEQVKAGEEGGERIHGRQIEYVRLRRLR